MYTECQDNAYFDHLKPLPSLISWYLFEEPIGQTDTFVTLACEHPGPAKIIWFRSTTW